MEKMQIDANRCKQMQIDAIQMEIDATRCNLDVNRCKQMQLDAIRCKKFLDANRCKQMQLDAKYLHLFASFWSFFFLDGNRWKHFLDANRCNLDANRCNQMQLDAIRCKKFNFIKNIDKIIKMPGHS